MCAMNSQLYVEWAQKALKLKLGEELYIQGETRDEMLEMYRNFVKEILILKQVNPVEASSLMVGKIFKDARHWVVLKRVASNPHVGFVRKRDGTINRITLAEGVTERQRKLFLMRTDGLSREDIEELEGPLSEEEVKTLWGDDK